MTTEQPALLQELLRTIEDLYYKVHDAAYHTGFVNGVTASREHLSELLVSAAEPTPSAEPQKHVRTPSLPPDTDIDELKLSSRARNAAKRAGAHTVGALATRSADDLLDLMYFGTKSLDEVRAKLGAAGYALRGEELA